MQQATQFDDAASALAMLKEIESGLLRYVLPLILVPPTTYLLATQRGISASQKKKTPRCLRFIWHSGEPVPLDVHLAPARLLSLTLRARPPPGRLLRETGGSPFEWLPSILMMLLLSLQLSPMGHCRFVHAGGWRFILLYLLGWSLIVWSIAGAYICLLYTSPSPRDATLSRMPSSA